MRVDKVTNQVLQQAMIPNVITPVGTVIKSFYGSSLPTGATVLSTIQTSSTPGARTWEVVVKLNNFTVAGPRQNQRFLIEEVSGQIRVKTVYDRDYTN